MKNTSSTFVTGLAVVALVALAPTVHAEVSTTTQVMTTSAVATSTSSTTTTPVVTSSTTVTTGTTSTFAALLEQLSKLTALFNSLKAQMMGVQSQIKEVKEGLGQGASGDEVKAIQEFLASDSSVYPAGLKTGFFGPMTTEAIKRFQTKNGLEVTGAINTETKAALDALMKERHDNGRLPMGLMMASTTKGHFEDRLREHCGVPANASSSASATGLAHESTDCKKIGDKYKFEKDANGFIKKMMNMFKPVDKEMHGSSTMKMKDKEMERKEMEKKDTDR